MDTAAFRPIRTWQQSYVDAGKYAGSSVLIRQNGEERFFSAVGFSDIESRQPFVRDTVVRLYSMTKPVTSLAILILIDRGLVSLETPLDAILPAFQNPTALIPSAEHLGQTQACNAPTILQLLTHQAGFTYPFNFGLLAGEMNARGISMRPDNGTLDQQIKALSQLPLAFAPGQKWEYSVATDVLGAVIEAISGRGLDQFIEHEILDVLSMDETGFRLHNDQVERMATLYSVHDTGKFNVNPIATQSPQLNPIETGPMSACRNTTLFSGGGGLIGTIDDYAKFTEMLLRGGTIGGNQLVSQHLLKAMLRNQLPGEIADMGPTSFAEQPMKGMGFGLGGSVLMDQSRAQIPGSIGDFSWGGIASTYFWIDPKQDLSVVFFTQLLPSSAYPSRAELKALVTECI